MTLAFVWGHRFVWFGIGIWWMNKVAGADEWVWWRWHGEWGLDQVVRGAKGGASPLALSSTARRASRRRLTVAGVRVAAMRVWKRRGRRGEGGMACGSIC